MNTNLVVEQDYIDGGMNSFEEVEKEIFGNFAFPAPTTTELNDIIDFEEKEHDHNKMKMTSLESDSTVSDEKDNVNPVNAP